MESLQQFWNVVKDVWSNGLMGVDVGALLIALAIFYVFVLLRHVIARFFIGWMRVIVSKTKTTLDDDLLNNMEGPLGLIPITFGVFAAGQYLHLEDSAAQIMSNVLRSLIALFIFWGAYNASELLSRALGKAERIFTPVMIHFIVRALKVVFVILGAATILEVWGIKVGPLIAGLGLFGVAVALGAQDLFKNLISGVLVIAERRFNKGDWIKVDGIVEGTVETIGFRSTVVRRFDKAPVYVPNAKFSDNAVTNFSAMTHRRIYWKIGVEYKTNVEQLKQIRDGIEEYVVNNVDFADPSEVSTFVRIDAFNASSIDIMLYCFTKTTNWGEWLAIKEQLAYKIKDIVEGAGSGFAFPSQSIYVETMPSESAEVFTPPADKKKKPVKKKSAAKKKSPTKKKTTARKKPVQPGLFE